MAHRKQQRYTNEFKQQIVDLYHAGTPVIQLAREYGLVEQTIYKWIKNLSPIIGTDEGDTVSLKEYKELQKKMDQLEMENEILKKATAIFARKH